jgi:hypothetical protein
MSTKGDCVDIGSRDDMRGRQSLHIIWVHNKLSENPNVYSSIQDYNYTTPPQSLAPENNHSRNQPLPPPLPPSQPRGLSC